MGEMKDELGCGWKIARGASPPVVATGSAGRYQKPSPLALLTMWQSSRRT
jgi:hypothetical protein